MDERAYSRVLDVHRISEYPEVQRVIHHLLTSLKESSFLGKSPKKKILKHLKVVVLDLYIAYSSDPLTYVSYPRGKDKYSKDSRLGRLFISYRPMMRVIDGLEGLGYLDNHKGFQDLSTGKSRLSRMRATQSLIDLIEDHSVTTSMISKGDQEVIVLRNSEKEDISYEDTNEIELMREQLLSYNSFIGEHQISLSLSEEEVSAFLTERNSNSIDYFRNRLCRVFNENFSRGGRFYQGWWQGIPSELRCYITIDGEPCSELDYSGQHLLLLYALKGEEQPWLRGKGDSYLIEGYGEELRDLMKQAFLICVNGASRDKAIQAIRLEINYHYKKVSNTNAFINPLIDAIMAKHPELSDCFFSGMWGELQYQDSQIAEYVLSHMQAWKQLVLPVHDSFVVRDKHIAQLFSIMKEAYRSLGIDSIPDVKPKLGVNADMKNPAFTELWKLMDQERDRNEIEYESVRSLETLV